MNSLQYSKERSSGVPCSESSCYFYDISMEQRCARQSAIYSGVGPEYCSDYFPDKERAANTNEKTGTTPNSSTTPASKQASAD